MPIGAAGGGTLCSYRAKKEPVPFLMFDTAVF